MAKNSVTGHSSWKSPAMAGYVLIILTFGFGGAWAAMAKLDRAIVAVGSVTVESSRKALQHLEGGMIGEILVKEGDHVEEGQILFRLQKIQAQANYDVVANQLDAALATEARLVAEREVKDEITWPPEFHERLDGPAIIALTRDQSAQFHERKTSLENQTNVLEARINQLTIEVEGLGIQRNAGSKQLEYIQTELVNLRDLQAKKLIASQRVFAMERERTRLEGDIGRLITEAAKARGSQGEVRLQIQQLRQKFQEDAATALLEVRQKISDMRERVRVATDVLKRVEITAPRTGAVQGLKVFTIGQVIRPGEPLLEIVPEDDLLIIQAQFQPADIDSVSVGQMAQINFPSFQDKRLPLMLGKLQTLSKDRLIDDVTRQPYFLGVISIAAADMPEAYRGRVKPGMQAEVLVAAGERTAIDYFVAPFVARLRTTFIEH